MKIFTHIAVALFMTLSCISAIAADLVVGKIAPSFEIKMVSGTSVTPATAKGRVLIIHFWATWCAPCREEMPEIEKFYQKYYAKGVDVVAISLDDKSDKETVKTVMKSFSFPAAMEYDIDMHRFGRIWRVPVTFVIDQNGILRYNGWEGEPSVNMSLLEKVVLPFLAPPASK
jgi:thiol-disulfide isomerase/thioredoxin